MNTVIHEFDPVIEEFWALTESRERAEINREWFNADSFTIVRTGPVANKKSGWVGNLVYILKPKQLDVKTICHESAHCADYLTESLGITNGSFEDGEAYAYLVGWIADCIWKVKTNKVNG